MFLGFPVLSVWIPRARECWILTASSTCLVIGSLKLFTMSNWKSLLVMSRSKWLSLLWSHMKEVNSESGPGLNLKHLLKSFKCCWLLTLSVREVSPCLCLKLEITIVILILWYQTIESSKTEIVESVITHLRFYDIITSPKADPCHF